MAHQAYDLNQLGAGIIGDGDLAVEKEARRDVESIAGAYLSLFRPSWPWEGRSESF
jgi:hypothetical protein